MAKKSLYTFRKKIGERHPRLVVWADKTTFWTLSLTHSKKNGIKNNIPLNHNPNKNDTRQAYVQRKVYKDYKFCFTKAFTNYVLSDEDLKMILQFLKTKKKK